MKPIIFVCDRHTPPHRWLFSKTAPGSGLTCSRCRNAAVVKAITLLAELLRLTADPETDINLVLDWADEISDTLDALRHVEGEPVYTKPVEEKTDGNTVQ